MHVGCDDEYKKAHLLISFAQGHNTVSNHESTGDQVAIVFDIQKIQATPLQNYLINFETEEAEVEHEQIEQSPLLPNKEYHIPGVQHRVKYVNWVI